jgi:photosynthetic reaction center cytochrome c subunit
MNFKLGMTLAIVAFLTILMGRTFERPPVDAVQVGYRGTGMVQVYDPRSLAGGISITAAPETVPPPPPSGQKASAVYSNVKVLGDVDSDEFVRLMTAITEWVSPEQGCAYCHRDGEDFAADTLYTKIVSRRMIEMTRHLNSDWKSHVATTGVTCYTCHRGNPVPRNVWFSDQTSGRTVGMLGNDAGQNRPSPDVGLTSLPYDPFTPFLELADNVRVISTTALPEGNRHSIKQTEWTYALMIHMSQALGVNCTFCHNTRSFTSWDQSSPQRTTAFQGIRLVRDLNKNFLEPLKPQFPPQRLGIRGEVPMVNCATCHQGAYKPLYGTSLLGEFPELAGGPGQVAPGSPVPAQPKQ